MKTILATLLVVVAVAPVAALAAAPSGDATKSAQADCTALKAKLGAQAFTQSFSTFGACVSKYAPVEQQNTTSAQATCTAQQADANFATAHGGKTFDQFYGTGKKGSNAFGNCVSTLAKASQHAEQQGRLNPAQTCRASRASLGAAAFATLYGKNANDRNAFGKCVSKTAGAQVKNEVSASASCKSEQSQDEAAFDQKYPSFGACVSGTAKEASTTQQQAIVSAAKQCYAQLKSDATTFRSKYRTFGACVSQTAHR